MQPPNTSCSSKAWTEPHQRPLCCRTVWGNEWEGTSPSSSGGASPLLVLQSAGAVAKEIATAS
ncbi:unnamed protein product, partial [Pleuronectes platessa]